MELDALSHSLWTAEEAQLAFDRNIVIEVRHPLIEGVVELVRLGQHGALRRHRRMQQQLPELLVVVLHIPPGLGVALRHVGMTDRNHTAARWIMTSLDERLTVEG